MSICSSIIYLIFVLLPCIEYFCCYDVLDICVALNICSAMMYWMFVLVAVFLCLCCCQSLRVPVGVELVFRMLELKIV